MHDSTKVSLLMLFLTAFVFGQNPDLQRTLIIRCDDIGMSHSVNLATEELAKAGLPFSASIMFACPWYQEGVDILKKYPHVTAGIHLTLNAEWKNYRWGPVAGVSAVPSLVDSCGFFFPSRSTLYANNPQLQEIETELRTQIERALKSGIKIEYMDYHMGTAVDKPEYRQIVEKLSKEYNIAISRYFGEIDTDKMYDDPVDSKLDSMLVYLQDIDSSGVYLLVCHIGKDNAELAAMIDMNTFGLAKMSKHRQAELDALVSEKFRNKLKTENYKVINYQQLIKNIGIDNMQRPADSGY